MRVDDVTAGHEVLVREGDVPVEDGGVSQRLVDLKYESLTSGSLFEASIVCLNQSQTTKK